MTELIQNMLHERLSATRWLRHALLKQEQAVSTMQTNGNNPSSSASSTSPPDGEDEPGLDLQSEEPDGCIKLLMKQTCSLYRALSDLLLTEHRDFIFKEISTIFVQNLEKIVAKVDSHK
jgi:hypothetical protein